MDQINKIYDEKCSQASDINEHLPVLKKYAQECEIIFEMGVRSIVSTWAFLSGNPKKLYSLDILHPSRYLNHDPSGCNLQLVEELASNAGIEFEFILEDSLKVKPIENDFLFIDTLHDYDQLKEELDKHHLFCRKYIGLHDTETFWESGETPGKGGIGKAIEEFISSNPEWVVKEKYLNNNGLTILEKLKQL